MPKFKVTSSHVGGPGKHHEVGDVIELNEKEGAWRTNVGLVKPHETPAPAVSDPPVDGSPVEDSPAAELGDGLETPSDGEAPLEQPADETESPAPPSRGGSKPRRN